MRQLDLETAPYAKGSDTSEAAAESIRPHLSRLEAVVFGSVVSLGGATCYEVEVDTGLSHQTASARINGLVRKCLLRDSGERRKTSSGRPARVLVKA